MYKLIDHYAEGKAKARNSKDGNEDGDNEIPDLMAALEGSEKLL